MNLKRTEAKILVEILDAAEFWCDCGNHEKTCAECQTYLDWVKAKESVLNKLWVSAELHGRHKKTPERLAVEAIINKHRAEKRYAKVTATVGGLSDDDG